MIDISKKEITGRKAVVEGNVEMEGRVIEAIKKNKIPKGNVLEAARIAGILAAKNTPHMIPLCHPIPIDSVDIDFVLGRGGVKITATVKAMAKTGVEMEAFAAVSCAALTIYDMCKPLDRNAVITGIKLVKKTGGKSGAYVREIRDPRSEIRNKSK